LQNPKDETIEPTTLEELYAEAARLRKVAERLESKAIDIDSAARCREAAEAIGNRKGKVAVFLGAGASKTFGWPLTNELLPIILDGLIKKDLFEDVRINGKPENEADRELLKKALIALCPGLEISRDYINQNRARLPLVTSLLSMLDFAIAAGHAIVPGLTPERVRDARTLLERAIYEAIEHEEEKQGLNYWPARQSNELNTLLIEWLNGVRAKEGQIGFITSNYDVAIEQAFGFDRDVQSQVKALAIDFGFDWTWPSNSYPPKLIRRPQTPKRRLYKLHGSTNWLRCGLCDRMYINPEVDIAVYAYDREADPNNACHCGHAKLEVQIVSPSFVREVRSPNLISVWQRAMDWLRRADDWIVIGYSFPDEDLNIRSLFTRALGSRDNPPFVTAIQFGTNEQTRIRYEAFFHKDRLRFLNCGLQTFLDHLDARK
jgi:hypothetical protein